MNMTDFDFYRYRDFIADDIQQGRLEPTPDAVAASIRKNTMVTASTAAHFAERFFDDLKRHLSRT